jgi:predicted HicB family RNase H-like nuclease
MAAEKTKIERIAFNTRINPELIRRLKYLAADKGKPLNHLIEEALELLLNKYKKKK